MARYNEINVGHFNRFIQKLTGIKGGPPSPQVSGDFQPIIPIFSGVENRYLGAWNRYGGLQTVPAVAVNSGGAQIRNPAGSNVIAVVERLYVGGVTAQANFDLTQNPPNPGDLGSAGPAVRAFDARASNVSSVCIVSSANTPSVGDLNNLIMRLQITVNSVVDFLISDNDELPLLPGDIYRVACQSANTGLTCGFLWRERFLEESERI